MYEVAVQSNNDILTAARQSGLSIQQQIHRDKIARERRMRAAATKAAPPRALPAPVKETPPVAYQRPVNPFEFLDSLKPILVAPAAVAVTFAIPDWLNPPGVKSIAQIRREVCRKYGITETEILADRREKRLVIPRHEVFWRARKESRCSLPQIGRLMGGRDHTTVLHGCANYERLRRIKAGITRATPNDAKVNFNLIIGEDE